MAGGGVLEKSDKNLVAKFAKEQRAQSTEFPVLRTGPRQECLGYISRLRLYFDGCANGNQLPDFFDFGVCDRDAAFGPVVLAV